MKDKVRSAKTKFKELYGPVIESADNHLMTGIGLDERGNDTIVANLTNGNCKGILPKIFDGFKVEISIIGDIVAQEEKE